MKIRCTGADNCGNKECRHAQLHWPHGNVCAYKTDCMGIKDVYCEEPQKIKKMTADHLPDRGGQGMTSKERIDMEKDTP